MFGGIWNTVLIEAGIYAIAAVGLQIAMRAGCFSVMHAALMGIAAYVVGYSEITLGLNGLLGAVFAIGSTAALGAITAGLLTRLEGLFFAIATLAAGQVISFAVQVIPDFGGPGGLVPISLTTQGSWVLIGLVVITAAALLAERTRGGLRLFVAGKDPTVAAAMAVPVRKVRIYAFTISAAIAGLAGVLYAHYVGLVQPSDLSFGAETNLLLFVVVGGVESPLGAVLGTFAIQALLQGLGASQLDRYWIFGVLVVGVVLFRPRGAVPRMRRRLRDAPADSPHGLRPLRSRRPSRDLT